MGASFDRPRGDRVLERMSLYAGAAASSVSEFTEADASSNPTARRANVDAPAWDSRLPREWNSTIRGRPGNRSRIVVEDQASVRRA